MGGLPRLTPLPDEPGNPSRDMCRRSGGLGGFVRPGIQFSKMTEPNHNSTRHAFEL